MKTFKNIGLTFLLITIIAISPLMAQKINFESSAIQWTGYHLAKSYEHVGNVKIKAGEVEIKDGKLMGGHIVIDMTSITNNDLEGGKNAKLVNHLKSDDFFNTEKYPESSLKITAIERNANNYAIDADITIRGITKPVSFTLTQSENTFSGKLGFDRSLHEVMYGWSLENAMLSNTIDLDVKIVLATGAM